MDEETGAYYIPISDMRWRRGCPYVRSECIEKTRTTTGLFIPTLTDESLDDELIAMLWVPRHRHENGLKITDPPLKVVPSYISDLWSAKKKVWLTKSEARYLYKLTQLLEHVFKHYGLPLDFNEAEAARLAKLEEY